MRLCPACNTSQSDDRFNDKFSECFRCRISGISFSFGPQGGNAARHMFKDVTQKEFRDETFKKARANGLDPVPVGKGTYAGPLKMPAVKVAA